MDSTVRLKSFVKSSFPHLATAYRFWVSHWQSRQWMGRSADAIFKEIYQNNVWGQYESVSGSGSSLRQTAKIRSMLPELVANFGIESVLDAPCGDYNWMKEVTLPVKAYVGVDIVAELVERNTREYGGETIAFKTLNLLRDPLPPKMDLILCRDCLMHFSYKDISLTLRNFKASGAKLLLTTTYIEHSFNIDCFTGHWRPLNLELPPFNLPRPTSLLLEHCTECGEFRDKALALWRFSDLTF